MRPGGSRTSDGSDGDARASTTSGEVAFAYRLARRAAGQPVRCPRRRSARAASRVRGVSFIGRAARRRRVSVQLRFAADGEARWGKSVYFDSSAAKRERLRSRDFRRADGPPNVPTQSRDVAPVRRRSDQRPSWRLSGRITPPRRSSIRLAVIRRRPSASGRPSRPDPGSPSRVRPLSAPGH